MQPIEKKPAITSSAFPNPLLGADDLRALVEADLQAARNLPLCDDSANKQEQEHAARIRNRIAVLESLLKPSYASAQVASKIFKEAFSSKNREDQVLSTISSSYAGALAYVEKNCNPQAAKSEKTR